MNKVFIHVDLDAFFASVEQRDHPEYKGKPVIIGGLPGDRRAVVSTASYEARKYGVHSAMPLIQAIKLCPNGIYLRGNHQHYEEISSQIMDIFANYSPSVIQMSIDEAFIDITGTEKLFGSPEEVALKIKQEVKEKTGLTVSAGIASTMYVAKIASGLNKPDGLTICKPGEEESFMQALPIEKLWGMGEKSQARLKNAGFHTIKSIYDKPLNFLVTVFGNGMGTALYNSVRGNKDLQFGQPANNRSLSSEITFEYDLYDRYIIETQLLYLSQHVIYRLHKAHCRSRTVSLKIRYEDFTTVSVQETSERFISNTDDLFQRCKALFARKYEDGRSIRLLGVAADNLEDKSIPVQQELFDFGDSKKAKVEEAIFNMEDRHPELKIRKARLLKKND